MSGQKIAHPVISTDPNQPTPKRASKACSRCRRQRSKCVPLQPDRDGIPPCQSCVAYKVEDQCVFPPRGLSALDRAHRRRRQASSSEQSSKPFLDSSSSPGEVAAALIAFRSPETPQPQLHKPPSPFPENPVHSVSAYVLPRPSDRSHLPPPPTLRPAPPPPAPPPPPEVQQHPQPQSEHIHQEPTRHRDQHLDGGDSSSSGGGGDLDTLPPLPEVVEAIRRSTASYFQLGFLHKALFVEQYTHDPKSISVFLLLAICSIAAPFTPVLVERYGGKKRATDRFLGAAQKMIGDEMVQPSLERAQAFLLLGVAEWGQGNGPKAWMLVGTAVRMAGFLGLHREATYRLPSNPSPEDVIASEVARRTFWAITCHENLLSGQSRPIFVSLAEIDVLLPCEESDFTFGIQPPFRASLAGTLASTQQNSGLASSEPRSLFASLVQVKILWSLTARHACRCVDKAAFLPWSASSQSLLTALQDFESGLPTRHRFSMTNLRGMMVEGVDLAFLSITLITRLSNIVIRRMYLSSMAVAMDPEVQSEMSDASRHFWQEMAAEMVKNSEQLLSQVETFFTMRPPQDGFPPIMVFGVFMCGNVFSYLWKWPELCPPRAGTAQASFQRSLSILAQLSDSWPIAAQWHDALQIAGENSARQQGHFRATVREERTLDDELGGIYGPRSQAANGLSPEESVSKAGRQSHTMGALNGLIGSDKPFIPSSPELGIIETPNKNTSALVHTSSFAHNPQIPSTSGLAGPANLSLDAQFDGLPLAADAFGDQSMSFDGGQLDNDLLFDTFGEDISAFMQGAMPTMDSDTAWIWGR